MGDSFQVQVFGAPGMEIMPECNGCMCYNPIKTMCFERFNFFYLFIDLVSSGRDLDDIFVSFGNPGGTLSDF